MCSRLQEFFSQQCNNKKYAMDVFGRKLKLLKVENAENFYIKHTKLYCTKKKRFCDNCKKYIAIVL